MVAVLNKIGSGSTRSTKIEQLLGYVAVLNKIGSGSTVADFHEIDAHNVSQFSIKLEAVQQLKLRKRTKLR